MTKRLILILGDQLSFNISSLQEFDKDNDHILMCEIKSEATYVKHHKKKIALIFSAMRHFSKELNKKRFPHTYVAYEDKKNTHNFTDEIKRAIYTLKPDSIVLTEPGEYRLLRLFQSWKKDLDIDVEILEDDRFYCSIEDFKSWSKDYKQLKMENFYRHLRKEYQILVEDNQPIGGQWNFDAENRKSPKDNMVIPPPYSVQKDDITHDVITLVEKHFDEHFGSLTDFHFAVTHTQAMHVLEDFIESRLPKFGDYQDAMISDEPWMYHAHISFYLNIGLLDPHVCIDKAIAAYQSKKAPINAVEGFIRQILGWREFIRGIYWLSMPEYTHKNHFHAQRKLPELYWTGETKMACLRQCVNATKEHAYAHHIQRLMVLGNFALLCGFDPKAVSEWYLIVYADAFEWVELPNVMGMILYADGGLFATKPYAAGGNYIRKMSNYCESCEYKVSVKTGETACPFNYLYWNFLIQHEKQLSNNHRMGMIYNTLKKMSKEKRETIQADSKAFIDALYE